MRTACLLVCSLALGCSGAAKPASRSPGAGAEIPGPGPAEGLSSAARAAIGSVDPEHIRAHVKFLASDALEGRGTGQPGSTIAAEYIAAQFALAGLRPAGDGGTYLQRVPLVGLETLPASTFTLLPARGAPFDLGQGADLVAVDSLAGASSEIDAPLVFVGYGIEAPEYRWNDFKDADVHGKVLVVLVGEPPSRDPAFFRGEALSYYGRWMYKLEQAARKGALGAIIVHKTEMAGYGWEVVRSTWVGERACPGEATGQLALAAWVHLAVGEKLARAAGTSMDRLIAEAGSRDFRPRELRARVRARILRRVRRFDAANVVGLLPGSDPKLQAETVLYTAHLDHLGRRPWISGDNIWNGAVDNATGCGLLLEVARAFASAPERPRRSVLFVATAAEEQGLLGSQFLARHLPATEVTLGLNFDGFIPLGMPESVDVDGAERTTFYGVVAATAAEHALKITPPTNPAAGYYYRADHFSLARVGIPAFSINQGVKYAGHPPEWSRRQQDEWVRLHFHRPSDEYDPAWDFRGMAAMARFGMALGWKAADLPARVAWRAGGELEAGATIVPPCARPLQGYWQGTAVGSPPGHHIVVHFDGRRVTFHRDGRLGMVARLKRCEAERLTLDIPVAGTVVMTMSLHDRALTLTPAGPSGPSPLSLRRLDRAPALPSLAPARLGKPGTIAPQRLAEVRAELIRRGELDQAVRRDPARAKDLRSVDADNLAYLGKVLAEVGWIDVGRFGRGASLSAFLIVQHSGDLPLMLAVLPELKRDHEAGHPVGQYYALLYDRLQLTLGGRQRYGSQIGQDEQGALVVLPLEDRARVDAWRKEVGLEPLAKYLEGFRAANGGKAIGFSEGD